MHHISTLKTAVTHQVYAALRPSRIDTDGGGDLDSGDLDSDDELAMRDRGAVSLEQVLWFVAAGVSVAVIAGVLWSTIRTEAERPITPPSAP